jgi:neopullulanase
MAVDTPAWVRDAVFYQIFPDRFAASTRVAKPGPLEPWGAPPTTHGFKGGDLLGIVERLPYLADLGVTALYLTPIFTSASNHRYHTYDYLSVDPLLGGDLALRELIDAAHGRGMRIVLDGVFNHTGRGFWPFHHIIETGLASPYLDWFHVDRAALTGRSLQPYPSGRSRGPIGYRAWWNLPALPKLNTDHPPVREYLFSVAEHWLRFGIDGWRLDVPQEIDDADFWREFRRRCRAARSDAYLVGEIWRPAPDWLEGDRFDAVMNYPLAEAILSFVAGRRLDLEILRFHHEYSRNVRPIDGPAFADRLTELLGWYDPAVTVSQLNLLGSHDAPRFLTLAGGDRAAFLLGTLLQMTLPGAPCIYYGDEIGLEGGRDPDCRRAFPPDEEAWDLGVLEAVRRMVALRREVPAFRSLATAVLAADECGVALLRGEGEDAAVVVVNAGDRPWRPAARVPVASFAGRPVRLESWPPDQPARTLQLGPDGMLTLDVPARTGITLRAA